MIIDFHTHTFPDKIAAAAVAKLEQTAHAISHSDGTRGGLLQSMQAAGIDHAVVLPVATNPLKCASMNDTSHALDGLDGLTYFAAIHPDAPDWYEELARAKALGFRGVKIHPDIQNFQLEVLPGLTYTGLSTISSVLSGLIILILILTFLWIRKKAIKE